MTTTRPEPTAVRKPLQARSKATLERIVDATIELLETRTFDEITISEIVARARSSVGSFYARFPDKSALLDYLDERYARQVIDMAAALKADPKSPPSSLRAEVRRLVAFLVAFHGLEPGLLRTLIVEARRQGEGSFRERTRRMNATVPVLVERLLAWRDEIGHPDPARAIYLGFLLVFSAIRETTLFPEGLADLVDFDGEELTEELTNAFLAYLRAEGS